MFSLRFDDLLKAGDLSVGFAMHKRQLQRVQQRLAFTLDLIDNKLDTLDFSSDQEILVDREDAPWVADEQGLEQLWRAQAKDEVLRLKLAGKDMAGIREKKAALAGKEDVRRRRQEDVRRRDD